MGVMINPTLTGWLGPSSRSKLSGVSVTDCRNWSRAVEFSFWDHVTTWFKVGGLSHHESTKVARKFPYKLVIVIFRCYLLQMSNFNSKAAFSSLHDVFKSTNSGHELFWECFYPPPPTHTHTHTYTHNTPYQIFIQIDIEKLTSIKICDQRVFSAFKQHSILRANRILEVMDTFSLDDFGFAVRMRQSKSHSLTFLTCWAYRSAIYNYQSRKRSNQTPFFQLWCKQWQDWRKKYLCEKNRKTQTISPICSVVLSKLLGIVSWENHFLAPEWILPTISLALEIICFTSQF